MDERPLPPSERRIADAVRQGRWPAAPDLSTSVILGITALLLLQGLPAAAVRFARATSLLYAGLGDPDHLDPGNLLGPLMPLAVGLLGCLGAVALLAFLVPWGQKGFPVSVTRPDTEGPVRWPPALAEPALLARSVAAQALRAAVVGAILWAVLARVRPGLGAALIPAVAGELAGRGFLLLALGLLLSGMLQYLFRKQSLLASLGMTQREAREEARETEGDPRVRDRLRNRSREALGRGRSRPLLLVGPSRAALVLLFEDPGQAPILAALPARSAARELEALYGERGLALDCPGLDQLAPGMAAGKPVPEELHELLSRNHRRIFPREVAAP